MHKWIAKVDCKTWNMEWNGTEWNLNNNRSQGLHSYMLATTQMFLTNIPIVWVYTDGTYPLGFLMMKEQIEARLL